jgi:hypothetical protein
MRVYLEILEIKKDEINKQLNKKKMKKCYLKQSLLL